MQLETRLIARNNVSGAVDGRGGHASLSEVVAAPGVRRDAEDGYKVFGIGEPVGKVGQAALVPKSGVWGGSTCSTVRRRRAASRRIPEAGRAGADGGRAGADGAWGLVFRLK
ncbi:hypothetical protein [Neolewinella persica]|uniref:hypothetical protein n=1 Tax=Neolewinella persica TaxID=70998 RepID=UPI000378E420|nr:hypothetical protein [Neolewinella persica]